MLKLLLLFIIFYVCVSAFGIIIGSLITLVAMFIFRF